MVKKGNPLTKFGYNINKIRDMKKEKRVEFGIEIVKPWSKEMYDHNDEVAEVVKAKVHTLWATAFEECELSQETDEDDFYEAEFLDMDWENTASEAMIRIQKAVTCYGFGSGFSIGRVAETVEDEIEYAAYFRLKEIAEELDIALEKGFVGIS